MPAKVFVHHTGTGIRDNIFYISDISAEFWCVLRIRGTHLHVHIAESGGETPAMVQRTTRQLWGLTARCKRAIRAMAPYWQAQASSWGEAVVLFERLLLPATWLCQAHLEIPCPPAALRLLTSSAASAAKAVQLTGVWDSTAGINPFSLFISFAEMAPALQTSTATAECQSYCLTLLLPRLGPTAATPPGKGPSDFFAAAGTLDCAIRLAGAAIPRGKHYQQASGCALSTSALGKLSSCHMSALVNQLIAQLTGAMGHAPIAAQQRGAVHLLIGGLSDYASMLASEQRRHATDALGRLSNHHADAATSSVSSGSSLSLKERLALLLYTVQSLLGSPLLDFLVGMQHVVIKAWPSLREWSVPEAGILPVHLMPASMDPDALESQLALQVGGFRRYTLGSISGSIRCIDLDCGHMHNVDELGCSGGGVHRIAITWVTWIVPCTARCLRL